MNSLNQQQSLIEIVNQGHGRPADGIPGDRASALGNPFDMQRNERLRDPVCDAYDAYFNAVIGGESPVPVAQQIAQDRGLKLASAWKRPSREAFMSALAVLEQRQAAGKKSKIMCWCAPGRCHLETPKRYLDQRAQQTQPKAVETESLPLVPQQPMVQTESRSEREPVTGGASTDIANSIQLLGQLSEPMLSALTARLETVKANLHEDVSNYARGRLNTWVGVQWDLKDKQFIAAGFWDEQLWELGQRLYPGSQLMLLTYSGHSDSTGKGIGLHRDDSYARFEARTLSVETREAESTWFMRQTYPGMTFEKQQNEQAGVHEFSLPSGSVITFNCKNQHAVEPGTGRWSLNLWQCSDKFQAAYRDFVETYGQSGGATPHRPAGRDLILPKPIHVTEPLRKQLSAPTVTRVMSLEAFNSRQTQVRPTARAVRQQTSTAAVPTAEESEPLAYTWSRYAPVGAAGYECSTQGDRRFSALNARLKDGRTIEEAYQLDVKGYRVRGNDWRLGKGKPPLQPMPVEALYSQYKGLWQQWAAENPVLMDTLATEANGKVLTDKFASMPISQARVLAELLNERQLTTASVSQQTTAAPDRITALESHQVFVFGSNTEGRHGAGAARQAVQFGAEYGNPRGRQGQTYAIVTKDLTQPQDQQLRSVPLHDIESQINEFLSHTNAHPQSEFLVTRFGCALAGYSEAEIGGLWVGKTVPTNVRLPQAFLNVVQAAVMETAIARQQTNTNTNTMELLNQSNQNIQIFCSTEAFRRAIDPTDFGTPDEMGVGRGGCLMVACALQDSLNVGEVCLLTSTDLQQPDDFPVFRHAVVRLDHPEGVHYLDGFGLHTEAEFKARWVTPDEQNDFKIDLEPLTPQSLELAVSNQGAYFHKGTVAVLTELCTAGLSTEALQLQSVFSGSAALTTDVMQAVKELDYSTILSAHGHTDGPTTGCCWLVAKAIQNVVGGELYYLDLQVGAALEGSFVHAVVKHGDHYLDSEGAHTAEALLSRWSHEENNGGYLSLLALDFVPDHVPTDQKTVDALTAALTTQPERATDVQAVQPVQYLFYTDHESCPQVDSTDVYTKTELLTRKALQEAQRLGYSNAEFIVGTANDQPGNVRATQVLLHAVEAGVKKETFIKAVADKPPVQATCRTTTTALLDLKASDRPDHRLVLIGNGNSVGTTQIVQQAQTLGVKVIGYNPDTREFLGSTVPKATPAVSKTTKARSHNER